MMILRRFVLPIKISFRDSSYWGSLKSRGLVSKIVPGDIEPDLDRIFSSPQCFYIGFDPTAPSLHVGHLAPLMLMLRLQRSGHQPIALLGSATCLIGDPTGRNTGRPSVAAVDVEANMCSVKLQLERISANHETYFAKSSTTLPNLKILNNLDWYKEKNVLEFFLETKGFVSMADLLKKDSVKERLQRGQTLSFAEFSYQVFQAYDWLHLYSNLRCVLQIGGHDQLGNIMTGYEMIKRATRKRVFGVTVPLIKSSVGDKLGKTAGNAVWLDSMKTSPFELFQYFFRFPDKDMSSMLRIFTFMSEAEIESVLDEHTRKPELRKAQRHLAKYVTKLIHGASGVDSAVSCSEVLYSGSASALASLSSSEMKRLFSGVPSVDLYLSPEMTVMDVARSAGCFADESFADSAIREGGFSINHRRVLNPNQCLVMGEHILPNNMSLLRVGKKNFYLVNWQS